MYSLVNAPTVGFDLARLPTGAAVATVLLEALAIQGTVGEPVPDLSGFDAVAVDDPQRASAWLEVSALTPPGRLDDALSAARQLVDEAANAVATAATVGHPRARAGAARPDDGIVRRARRPACGCFA